MSQHPSLRVGGKIRKVRNVMKRYERIDVLRADGRHPGGEGPRAAEDQAGRTLSGRTIRKDAGRSNPASRFFFSVGIHFFRKGAPCPNSATSRP